MQNKMSASVQTLLRAPESRYIWTEIRNHLVIGGDHWVVVSFCASITRRRRILNHLVAYGVPCQFYMGTHDILMPHIDYDQDTIGAAIEQTLF